MKILIDTNVADFLITGDNDLLQAKSSVATRIVTVAEFASEFAVS